MSHCYPLFTSKTSTSVLKDPWFFLRFEAPPGLPPSDPSPSVASWGAQGGPAGVSQGDLVLRCRHVVIHPFFSPHSLLHENANILLFVFIFSIWAVLFNISLSCHFVIHFVGPLRPGRGAGCGRPDGDGTATTVAGDAEEGGTFDRNDRTSKRKVMTDTLAQKHLIELLMWNASDVQRQLS